MEQMTKEKALEKLDELTKYIEALDDSQIKIGDVKAFAIFNYKSAGMMDEQEHMLLPYYSGTGNKMFLFGGLCGDFGSPYSNRPLNPDAMLKELQENYKKSNKVFQIVEKK